MRSYSSPTIILLGLSLTLAHGAPDIAHAQWSAAGAESLNVRILGHYPIESSVGIWDCAVYMDGGHPYGLIGADSLYIIDLEDYANPRRASVIPPQTDPGLETSKYVDVVVRGQYAYAAVRTGPIVIVDLNDPDNASIVGQIPQHEFCACSHSEICGGGPFCVESGAGCDQPDSSKAEIEALFIDSRGYLYVTGLAAGQGMHVYDLAPDPTRPRWRCNIHNGPPSFYDREVHVYEDTLYVASSGGATLSHWEIFSGAPCPPFPQGDCGSSTVQLVASFTHSDPDLHAHSQWRLRDQNLLLTNDEEENGHVRIWDLSELPAVTQVGDIQFDQTCHSVHNVYSTEIPGFGEVVFAAWYNRGVDVFRVAPDPVDPFRYIGVQLGFYRNPMRWMDGPGAECCNPNLAGHAHCAGVPFLDATLPNGVFLAAEGTGGAEGGLLIGQFYGDAAEAPDLGSNDLAEHVGEIEVRGLPGGRETQIRWRPGRVLDETFLEIVSADGRIVARVSPIADEHRGGARTLSYRWTGEGESGARLPGGIYFIRPPGEARSSGVGKLVLLD